MVEKRRFHELIPDAEERAKFLRNLRYYIQADKRIDEGLKALPYDSLGIVSGGYLRDRGLKARGEYERWEPGYNDLHGVDFIEVVDRLRGRFQGDVLQVLDVGCGKGRFGWDLMHHYNQDGQTAVNVSGTNFRKVSDCMIPCKVMIAENLKLEDDLFPLTVSTSAATQYTLKLDLVLDNLYRVTRPGGEVYFQGLPENLNIERAMKQIYEFGERRGITIRKNDDSIRQDAFWFVKPQ